MSKRRVEKKDFMWTDVIETIAVLIEAGVKPEHLRKIRSERFLALNVAMAMAYTQSTVFTNLSKAGFVGAVDAYMRISSCAYLRVWPDHTVLTADNEVVSGFLATTAKGETFSPDEVMNIFGGEPAYKRVTAAGDHIFKIERVEY